MNPLKKILIFTVNNIKFRHLISGSGRSAREGIGYPLQYSWAFLVAQLVKNLPAMWETWVQFLVGKYPLEKQMVTHSAGLWPAVHGAAKSQTWLSLSLLLQQCPVSQLKLICKTIKLNKLKEKLFSHIEKQAVHDSDAWENTMKQHP